jgi:hypothetical protein
VVVGAILTVAGTRFRKINAPHLAAEVYCGVKFEDGVKVTRSRRRSAA